MLTEEDIVQLKLAHKQTKDKRLADRIKAVLYLHYGLSSAEIAKLLLFDEVTIRRYKKQFTEKGLDGLLEYRYTGGKTRLTTQQEEELHDYLQAYTLRTAKEVGAHIQKTYHVQFSIIGVTKLLHRLGFVYKKPKIVPGKLNQQLQEQFLSVYEQTKQTLGPHDRIYFLDSTHPTHKTNLAYGWILKGKCNDKWVKSSSGRKRLNLNGAISLTDKKAIVLEEPTINARATLHLLNEIKRKQRLGKVYIILDNAKHHHSRAVKNWLLRRPRFTHLYLPAYSPNLNIIERLWRYYHQQITYNRYFETFNEFKKATLDFFEQLKPSDPHLATLLADSFQTFPS